MRVMIVAGDVAERQRVRGALAGLPELEIVEVGSCETALAALRCDLPFSLIALTDDGGVATIRELRRAGHAMPILVITSREDEIVTELTEAGATDVLSHDEVTRRRVEHAMRLAEAEAQAKASRAELERAIRSRDELLAIVSHDLRNPLHAVGLAIDELASTDLDPEMRARYVAAIHRSLGRAGQLIRDLLDVSRLDANGLVLERHPVSVRDVLDGTARDHALLLREAHMAARVVIDPAVAPRMIDIDPARTTQALGNLVTNAIKYASGTEAIELIGRTDGQVIELVVADRGPGIDPEILPHIFDRFFQAEKRRRAGAGLGLAIARGIARAHGGDLTVHLREGGGTEFCYRVPAVSP